ncbi:MAG: acyltransferase family protein, partial [Bacteroidota bacterium]
ALLRVFRRGQWRDVVLWLPLLIVPTAGFVGGKPEGLVIIWLLGAAGFFLWRTGFIDRMQRWQYPLLLAWGVLLAVASFWRSGEEYDATLACCSLAVLLLLLAWGKEWHWPPWLAWFSRQHAAYSYTLYLTHYSILDLLRTVYGDRWSFWLLLGVGVVVSNVVAAGIGLVVEVGWTRRVKAYLHGHYG